MFCNTRAQLRQTAKFQQAQSSPLFCGNFCFKHRRTGLGNFLILRRALCPADTDRTDDLAIVNNGHATLGREIRQRRRRNDLY